MRPTLLRRLCARSAAVAGAASKRHVPTVRLFTGPNCSLCDELKALLARSTQPHILELTDISDKAQRDWYRRYKWDIPVLHIDGLYFAKHRLERAELDSALAEAAAGAFAERAGEPDARGQNYEGA